MLGSILFLAFLTDTLLDTERDDFWISAFYESAILGTFAFSSMYHWFRICSKSCHENFFCLDMIGIELNGYLSPIRFMYVFGMDKKLFDAYVIIHSCIFGTFLMILYRFWLTKDCSKLMDSEFGKKFRFLLYISHIFVAYVSFYHHHSGPQNTLSSEETSTLESKMIINLLIYLFSGLIYAQKFPESTFPGKFDMFLNSHQIMHVLILLVAVRIEYS